MNGVIICGVDDSESAKGAARVARVLGSELGLDVLFVRAIEREAADADVDAISERPLRMAHARTRRRAPSQAARPDGSPVAQRRRALPRNPRTRRHRKRSLSP
jgi:hypothetical protein